MMKRKTQEAWPAGWSTTKPASTTPWHQHSFRIHLYFQCCRLYHNILLLRLETHLLNRLFIDAYHTRSRLLANYEYSPFQYCKIITPVVLFLLTFSKVVVYLAVVQGSVSTGQWLSFSPSTSPITWDNTKDWPLLKYQVLYRLQLLQIELGVWGLDEMRKVKVLHLTLPWSTTRKRGRKEWGWVEKRLVQIPDTRCSSFEWLEYDREFQGEGMISSTDTFQIEKGQFAAIIGPSGACLPGEKTRDKIWQWLIGCGKTSIISLLERLAPPSCQLGEILIC